MANPRLIETLSFVRGLRKDFEITDKPTLSEFHLQSLARHIENIEIAVQMHAVTNNSQKM